MPRPKHDLVSIANPRLAEQLDAPQASPSLDALLLDNTFLREQTWRAVLTLNLARYSFALFLLIDQVLGLEIAKAGTQAFEQHPSVFLAATITLLLSAILFSYLSSARKVAIEKLLSFQFFTDLLLITTLVHSSGANSDNVFLVYFLVVTTGSVALSRIQALALASAAFLMMALEQFYTLLTHDMPLSMSLETLGGNGLVLLISAFFISSLAYQIRKNQIHGYTPGGESLEAYLVREEVSALKATLKATKGNKTEEAKLLGLSFRSFRYKLTKYGLE